MDLATEAKVVCRLRVKWKSYVATAAKLRSQQDEQEMSWICYTSKITLFLEYIEKMWIGTDEQQPTTKFNVEEWSNWRSLMDKMLLTTRGGGEWAYSQKLRDALKNGRVWMVIDGFRSEEFDEPTPIEPTRIKSTES